MEDILAIVFLFGGGTCVLLAYSPVGAAIAERIRGRPAGDADTDHGAMLAELEALRRDVAELQERADFTERLLTAARETPQPPQA